MSSPPTPTPNPLIDLPEILLLCREKENIVAFQDALRKHWPAITFFSPSSSTTTSPQPTQQAEQKLKIIPLNERLNTVPHTQPFDVVVSPANSYGRLDGAFDDAISRTFCLPDHPYLTLTRAAQKTLYERWRGYAPPGTCTLVPFPEEIVKAGKALGGCRWVALCPTMRMPENVVWDREVVYKWKVSKERWAGQAVLAMKHFVDALERPERWGRLDWEELGKDSFEVETTWKPEERRKKSPGFGDEGNLVPGVAIAENFVPRLILSQKVV
ncbi:conserved hypothetical protein [Histoplasma capsulatum H143]|uniref:Uncharacterized protein n=1 Tax=Ajellomyces capsulatus (strain H143) TaxID=544712 RepID=C6HHP9_AJECH|nr:conserved hypothetical protein [Histoplasma capsulatum H143]